MLLVGKCAALRLQRWPANILACETGSPRRKAAYLPGVELLILPFSLQGVSVIRTFCSDVDVGDTRAIRDDDMA
jgi:hypothetical protein